MRAERRAGCAYCDHGSPMPELVLADHALFTMTALCEGCAALLAVVLCPSHLAERLPALRRGEAGCPDCDESLELVGAWPT